jgi:hypothetical protein
MHKDHLGKWQFHHSQEERAVQIGNSTNCKNKAVQFGNYTNCKNKAVQFGNYTNCKNKGQLNLVNPPTARINDPKILKWPSCKNS